MIKANHRAVIIAVSLGLIHLAPKWGEHVIKHAWLVRLANLGRLLSGLPAPPVLVSSNDLYRLCMSSHTHSPMPIWKISNRPCPEIPMATQNTCRY